MDGDWDELKKYNMTELYNQAAGITAVGKKDKQQQEQKTDGKQPEPAKEENKEEEEPVSADA